MRAFACLYAALDETTATNEKVAALVEYFRSAPPEDAAWAVHFLTGRRPKRLVERALAQASGVDEGAISHRLMGGWEPRPEFFHRLVSADVSDADVSRPYPFYLAYSLEAAPESLGDPADWLAEWKWDGIRA